MSSNFGQWDLVTLPIQQHSKKFRTMFDICFLICILVFAPCVYIEIPLWSTRSELHFWAIVFGFLTYYIFRSYDKKFEKFMINISFVVCILVFAPFVYIELLEGASFLGNGIRTPCTFRNYDKKFQKSRINICFVVCILIFAPYLDIKLPLGSSGRELHVWGRGFGLLTHSGAMAKKFRSLRLIFALELYFSNCSLCIY